MAIKFDDRIVSNVADGILTEDSQILHTGKKLLLESNSYALNIATVEVGTSNKLKIDTVVLDKVEIHKVSDVPIVVGTLLNNIVNCQNANIYDIVKFINELKIDTNYANLIYSTAFLSLGSGIDEFKTVLSTLNVNTIYTLKEDFKIQFLKVGINEEPCVYADPDSENPYKDIMTIPAKSLITIRHKINDSYISTNVSNYLSILAMPYTPDQDATDLSAINAKLTSLEESNTQLTSKINLLEGTNSTLNEKVTSLEGANTTLNGKITTLESANSDLSGKVTTLEQDNTILKSENSTLKNQVHTLQHKLSLTTTIEL